MTTVRQMLLVSSVLAIVGITPAAAHGAANGVDRPVRGTVAGVASTDISTDPAPGNSQVSGQLSHLGAVTGTSQFLLTPLAAPPLIPYDVTGTAALVAANGDELFGTITGTGVNNAGATSGTNQVTITGGTGRFADATGALTETYTGALTSQMGTIVSGPITLSIQGRISY